MILVRHLPRFRKALRAVDVLRAREQWTREEIECYQLEQLNRVWRHAIAHVPYYRRLSDERRLPEKFRSLSEYRAEVPLLDKSLVRRNPADFLSNEPARGGWRRTGGSTGAPMKVYWGCEAGRRCNQARYRFYQSWNIGIFEPMAFLWGHGASFQPGLAGMVARWRQPIEDWLRNRLRLSAYRLGAEDLQFHLRRLEKFQPVSLYGYSRALYLLAAAAEEKGFRFQRLRLATLTGEPALPFIVGRLERVFGVPAVVEYGSLECGPIAHEGPDRRLRIREDQVYVEFVPRSDGLYAVVVTVLHNPSFPLLRYKLGDLSDGPLESPGRGFTAMRNVIGRNSDMVVARSGRVIHSCRFDAFFQNQVCGVRRFQLRQSASGAVHLRLQLKDEGCRPDLGRLRRELTAIFEGYPVSVEIVGEIPLTVAGKHRPVVSECASGITETGVDYGRPLNNAAHEDRETVR